MLSEREKKQIQKYCLLPKIAVASILMALAMCGVWLVLVMIDDIAFYNKTFYEPGMYAFIAFVILYMVLFAYALLVPKIGMSKAGWKELVNRLSVYQTDNDYSAQVAGAAGLGAAGRFLSCHGKGTAKKIGKGLEVAGAVDSVGVIAQMGYEMHANARAVADAFGVEPPKAKKYILPLALIPPLLLISMYVPEYGDSIRSAKNERQVAAESVYALQESFARECAYVSIDDPAERYQDYGYSVRGYLYDLDEEEQSYLSARVGSDGAITEVTYYVDINIRKSKEENRQRAVMDITRLHSLLKKSGVAASSADLLDTYTLSDEFTEAFAKGSYYEEVRMSEDGPDQARIYTSYDTDSEEEYDEYSRSYIYLYIVKR